MKKITAEVKQHQYLSLQKACPEGLRLIVRCIKVELLDGGYGETAKRSFHYRVIDEIKKARKSENVDIETIFYMLIKIGFYEPDIMGCNDKKLLKQIERKMKKSFKKFLKQIEN